MTVVCPIYSATATIQGDFLGGSGCVCYLRAVADQWSTSREFMKRGERGPQVNDTMMLF